MKEYRLLRDNRGIGFKTTDAVAMKLGIEKTAMIRTRAGIAFALTEALGVQPTARNAELSIFRSCQYAASNALIDEDAKLSDGLDILYWSKRIAARLYSLM